MSEYLNQLRAYLLTLEENNNPIFCIFVNNLDFAEHLVPKFNNSAVVNEGPLQHNTSSYDIGTHYMYGVRIIPSINVSRGYIECKEDIFSAPFTKNKLTGFKL